ncbi:bacterio-opsin activator [Halobellus salinus]|uniref:Bacterio-opsin activator n=1 Tax=Halobellus salinus TaxID=931585 RepID=A0A830EDT9_9EURY|nr:PAS domain-containing protein [Halobellus salinus]GGJ02401.1 bacterio-opsin activator [Halobellus salinus]SMP17278.1 PAS domain S-box-containing protein [Halobellus salinus]
MVQGRDSGAGIGADGDPAANSASTDTIDESLKTRTMDEAPIGITVADATEPEMPLVYVNAAFERVTGYPPEYAVGRNCRFLQGETTREEPVAEMRAAIEAGEATSVELRNYRRDGELFWNEVTIAPLRDERGTVTHYVGFQRDVTRRKRAERAATERAARIERERSTQERLLERLDGVVANVTEAVTRAESRSDLECAVVESIDSTYAGAWIGTYDPSESEIVPQETALTAGYGVGDRRFRVHQPQADGSEAAGERAAATPVDATAAAVSSAVTDQYVHINPITASDVTATAAVPLHYGNATYGAIGVYTRADEGFDNHERAILTALGRTVATGINALENQRTLQGEGVVELRFEIGDHPLVGVAAAAGCRFVYAGNVGDRQQPSMLFEAAATTSSLDPAAVRTAGGDAVDVHSVLEADGEGSVVELSVIDATLQSILTDHGGELLSLSVDEHLATVTVEVGQENLAQSFVDAVDAAFERVELASYRRREHRAETQRGFVADLRSELTDRQYAALARAYTAGYFEWPHDTTGEEIAEAMGIGRSTFHQHLRAAQRKLAGAIIDS